MHDDFCMPSISALPVCTRFPHTAFSYLSMRTTFSSIFYKFGCLSTSVHCICGGSLACISLELRSMLPINQYTFLLPYPRVCVYVCVQLSYRIPGSVCIVVCIFPTVSYGLRI